MISEKKVDFDFFCKKFQRMGIGTKKKREILQRWIKIKFKEIEYIFECSEIVLSSLKTSLVIFARLFEYSEEFDSIRIVVPLFAFESI